MSTEKWTADDIAAANIIMISTILQNLPTDLQTQIQSKVQSLSGELAVGALETEKFHAHPPHVKTLLDLYLLPPDDIHKAPGYTHTSPLKTCAAD